MISSNKVQAMTALAAAGLAITASAQPGTIFFFQNFDGIALGENIDEQLDGQFVWSSVPPAGWNNSGSTPNDPDINQENVGVREWNAWNFADVTWWSATAGDQGRATFVNGGLASGTVAVADPDEYDDRGSPFRAFGNAFYDVRLVSPSITLPALNTPEITVEFASSWDFEDFADSELVFVFNGTIDPFRDIVGAGDQNPDVVDLRTGTGDQKGSLGINPPSVTQNGPTTSGGTQVQGNTYTIGGPLNNGTIYTGFLWQSENLLSDASDNPLFKGTSYNETVSVTIPVPAGATSVQFAWRHFNAGNDWWHAIDNVAVKANTNAGVTLAPGTFSITSPANNGITGFTPTISWTASARATSYVLELFRTSVPTGTPPVLALSRTLPGTQTSFTVPAATLFAGSYLARVQAVNSGGVANASPSVFSAASQCAADLDGNNRADIFDIFLFFQVFGQGC